MCSYSYSFKISSCTAKNPHISVLPLPSNKVQKGGGQQLQFLQCGVIKYQTNYQTNDTKLCFMFIQSTSLCGLISTIPYIRFRIEECIHTGLKPSQFSVGWRHYVDWPYCIYMCTQLFVQCMFVHLIICAPDYMYT